MPRRLLSLLMGLAVVSAARASETWPQWRGPNRDGASTARGGHQQCPDIIPVDELYRSEALRLTDFLQRGLAPSQRN